MINKILDAFILDIKADIPVYTLISIFIISYISSFFSLTVTIPLMIIIFLLFRRMVEKRMLEESKKNQVLVKTSNQSISDIIDNIKKKDLEHLKTLSLSLEKSELYKETKSKSVQSS